MTFDPQAVTIQPGHCARKWQSCDYYAPGPDGKPVHLFHERTFMRSLPRANRHGQHPPAALAWLAFGPEPSSVQWMPGAMPREEADAIAARWEGATVEEEPYAPEGAPLYFLAFHDTDRALAFCASADWDRCLTMDKVTA